MSRGFSAIHADHDGAEEAAILHLQVVRDSSRAILLTRPWILELMPGQFSVTFASTIFVRESDSVLEFGKQTQSPNCA